MDSFEQYLHHIFGGNDQSSDSGGSGGGGDPGVTPLSGPADGNGNAVLQPIELPQFVGYGPDGQLHDTNDANLSVGGSFGDSGLKIDNVEVHAPDVNGDPAHLDLPGGDNGNGAPSPVPTGLGQLCGPGKHWMQDGNRGYCGPRPLPPNAIPIPPADPEQPGDYPQPDPNQADG